MKKENPALLFQMDSAPSILAGLKDSDALADM
jgi:hypothetical protein